MDVAGAGTLVGYIAGISVATERVVEIIKGIPVLGPLLSKDEKNGDDVPLSAMAVHILAIVVGAFFAWMTYGQIASSIGADPQSINYGVCILFGAMSSGGSGFWNSILGAIREVNKQKESARRGSVKGS